MGDGLVHQLIAEDGGLVLVTVGNLAPDVAEELLRGLTFVDPGIAVAIVDVVARLTSRTIMHVENQIEMVGTAPANNAVDTLIAVFLACLPHIVLIGKELVVEGQTDGVGSLLCNEVDVGLRYIIVLELLPEVGRGIRTHCFLKEQVDHPSRVRAAETEHIALGIQPIAEVCTLNKQLFTIGLNKINTLYGNKSCRLLHFLRGAGSQQEHGKVYN